MAVHDLKYVLDALARQDDLSQKIVSVQDFLHAEDAVLARGDAGPADQVEELSDEFRCDDIEALKSAMDEVTYIWVDEDAGDPRKNDRYMDAAGLRDYFLMRINEGGKISLMEVNAKFAAFTSCEDISAYLRDAKPEDFLLPDLSDEADERDSAPHSIPSNYIPYGIDGGANGLTYGQLVDAAIGNGSGKNEGAKKKRSLAEAFQDAARRDKVVSLDELNALFSTLEIAQPALSTLERDVAGHSAYMALRDVGHDCENNTFVRFSPHMSEQDIYLNGIALSFMMATRNMSDYDAQILLKAFDTCEDARGQVPLVPVALRF